jgi:hypothetical protein
MTANYSTCTRYRTGQLEWHGHVTLVDARNFAAGRVAVNPRGSVHVMVYRPSRDGLPAMLEGFGTLVTP